MNWVTRSHSKGNFIYSNLAGDDLPLSSDPVLPLLALAFEDEIFVDKNVTIQSIFELSDDCLPRGRSVELTIKDTSKTLPLIRPITRDTTTGVYGRYTKRALFCRASLRKLRCAATIAGSLCERFPSLLYLDDPL